MTDANVSKVYLIVNPARVDNVQQILTELAEACDPQLFHPPVLLETTETDPGIGQAQHAVQQNASLVIVSGGDGTVRAVCAGLAGTNVPLAIIPSGTGNLLARNLNVSLNQTEAIQTALYGATKTFDLGHIATENPDYTHQFTIMAGLGFDAHVMNDSPETFKKTAGWPAYLVGAFRHVLDRPRTLTVIIDGKRVWKAPANSVIIGNVGALQAGIELFPDADPNDGVLDVVVLAPKNFAHWVTIVTSVLTKNARRSQPGLKRFFGKEVVVYPSGPTACQADGDTLGNVSKLTATVTHHGLIVKVPEQT